MRFWDIVMAAATQGGGAAADPDPLGTYLAALEAAGKLVCAWYLPAPNPSQYLTLSGANVNGWTAAYGTQKVDLAMETAAPQWDATLFSNKGGVTFNGTTQRLFATGGNLSSWPDANTDLYMLAAVAGVVTSGAKRVFSYGAATTTSRSIGNTVGPVIQASAGSSTITGAGSLTGAHTIGVVFDIGGNSQVYLDGVADGVAVSTAAPALTATNVRIGASAAASASQFFFGNVACVAILGPTASLTDFTNLEALMRARVT